MSWSQGDANDDPILPQYLTAIEKSYIASVRNGIELPVAILLHLGDPESLLLAKRFHPLDYLETLIYEAECRSISPVCAAVVSSEKGKEALASLPDASMWIDRINGQGLIPIFIRSHGQMRWIAAPIPDFPSSDL